MAEPNSKPVTPQEYQAFKNLLRQVVKPAPKPVSQVYYCHYIPQSNE